MSCLTCARTGVCNRLPLDPARRRKFARDEHDCEVPLAKTVEERRGQARIDRLVNEVRTAQEGPWHENQN